MEPQGTTNPGSDGSSSEQPAGAADAIGVDVIEGLAPEVMPARTYPVEPPPPGEGTTLGDDPHGLPRDTIDFGRSSRGFVHFRLVQPERSPAAHGAEARALPQPWGRHGGKSTEDPPAIPWLLTGPLS